MLLSAVFTDLMQPIACGSIGLAVAWFFWWLFRVLATEELRQGEQWRYDISRINELRRSDDMFRAFYPLIQFLARFNRRAFRDSLPEINRQIQAAGLPRFWLAEEYLAKTQLLAVFSMPLWVYLFFGWFGLPGLMLAALGVLATAWYFRRRLAAQAAARLRMIKLRLPFLLDLLTLLMEAGSTFLNALKQGVEEFRGHPVAEEFGRVLTDINLGKTRLEAFQNMRQRLADDELTSIIGTIIHGEQLGTPLGQVFRSQADVLRIKRTQRAETVAGEAGVNMLLPAVLVMAATVLVIVGPYLLNYMRIGLAF